jgi:hypothetical protein
MTVDTCELLKIAKRPQYQEELVSQLTFNHRRMTIHAKKEILFESVIREFKAAALSDPLMKNTTSSRGQKHFFERCILVGPLDEELRTDHSNTLHPVNLASFPTNDEKTAVAADFCFPNGVAVSRLPFTPALELHSQPEETQKLVNDVLFKGFENLKEQLFVFTLKEGDDDYQYGLCLRFPDACDVDG